MTSENAPAKNFRGFVALSTLTLLMFACLWWAILSKREPVNGPRLVYTFSDSTQVEFISAAYGTNPKSWLKAWSPYGVPTPKRITGLTGYVGRDSKPKLACVFSVQSPNEDISKNQLTIQSDASLAQSFDEAEGVIALWFAEAYDGYWDRAPPITISYGRKSLEQLVPISPGSEVTWRDGTKWEFLAPDPDAILRPGPRETVLTLRPLSDQESEVMPGPLELLFVDGTRERVPVRITSGRSVGWVLPKNKMANVKSWSVVYQPRPETIEFSGYSTLSGTSANPTIEEK